MGDENTEIAAYVDAAATLIAMPVASSMERRSAVIATMTRLAAFAADVASVELGDDIELAGAFVP
jgi:hypothetical protein